MTLTGLYVPLITPFDETGAVALDALDGLAHRMLDGGASGLLALGTTAEPGSLTMAERHAVLDVAARVCRERGAPLIVGADGVEVLQALPRWPEVSAALTLVPPFVRPGEAGVLAYFAHLAAASPLPIVVYDIPYRTGQHLSVETLRRLADLSTVVGVKYAAGGITSGTVELMADRPAGFAVLGGDDPFISPLLALGADGGILASAHLETAAFARLISAWRAGEVAEARPLGHRLSALSVALFAEPNPSVVKAVLYAQGQIPSAAVRLPLVPAHPDSARRAQDLCEAPLVL